MSSVFYQQDFFIVCEPRALFVCPHVLSGTVQWLILLERETREIKFNALCMIFVDMNENGRQNLHVYGHPISVGFCWFCHTGPLGAVLEISWIGYVLPFPPPPPPLPLLSSHKLYTLPLPIPPYKPSGIFGSYIWK